jgi:uncharacterized membrane protein
MAMKMNNQITYAIIAIAALSVMVAPTVLSSPAHADKPTTTTTCEKQVGKGGVTEGACKQHNKNFETGTCKVHKEGNSGRIITSGQCP